MTRKLRTLGLALVAALALGALAASAASAENFVFTSAAKSSSLKGEQIGTASFGVDAGEASCKSGSFSGELAAEGAVELTLTPTFLECTAFGFNAEVAVHGCDFVLGTAGKEGTNYEIESAIDCKEAGESISVSVKALGTTKCTIDYGEQEGLKTVTGENEGTPTKIRAKFNLTGMKYTQTAGTGFAACAKAENTTNGTMTGEGSIKSLEGETAVNFKLEPIPQKVKILKNPLVFKKVGEKITFEVENVVNEEVTVFGMFKPPNIKRTAIKCGKLAKIKDKCTEEIECEKASGAKQQLAVITNPPFGGDLVKVEGC